MCEVGTVVLVNCQTETAFEAAHVVLKEVRVFVQIDGLKGEFAESFAAVCVRCGVRGDAAAAELGTCAVLQFR